MSVLLPLQEVRPRRGLGAVGLRLRQRPCSIAYIGNSVTAQRAGYRPRLHEILVGHFGQPHRPVNAALGAMGAMGSLFMLSDLVLRHAPDVCLIDCSLGDIGTKPPPESIGPVLEGMVRKLINAGCAVVLLHFFESGRRLDDSHPVIAEYERIAEHYGVPSINVARAFDRVIAEGRFAVDELFFDGVHTTEAGANVLAELLGETLLALFAAPAAAPVTCPPPLHQDHYEFARLVRAEPSMAARPDRCRPDRFRLLYPYLHVEPGNEIRFAPGAGSVAGLLLVLGPHSGLIRVRSGSEEAEYPSWDRWCDRERLHTLVFPRALAAGIALGVTGLETEAPSVAADRGDQQAMVPKVLKLAGVLFNEPQAAAAPRQRTHWQA